MTTPSARVAPTAPTAPGIPTVGRRLDGQTGGAAVGADGLLPEPGDGVVVDAAVHCAFIAAGFARCDVFAWFVPGIAGEWGGEKSSCRDR